jgi:hypothetical protein
MILYYLVYIVRSVRHEYDVPPCKNDIFFLERLHRLYFCGPSCLKEPQFRRFRQASGEVICAKSFVRPKECVKDDPMLPVDSRFYGARQNQQCEEKLPEEMTTV